MAEDIKALLEKIQKEGIEAAESKAQEIEAEAKKQAASIIQEAKLQAEKIISQAKEENKRMEISTRILLQQAGRDMLLSLRRQINAMLQRLITTNIQEALGADELAKIILNFVKEQGAKNKEDIIISLAKKDAEKLTGFISELKNSLKQNIIVRPCEDIQAGFIISFDAGKSEFDFSDQALAEYISLYLKPRLSEILKEAITQG